MGGLELKVQTFLMLLETKADIHTLRFLYFLYAGFNC